MVDRSEPPLTPTEIEMAKHGCHIVRYPDGDNRAKIKAVLEVVAALTGGEMPTDVEIDEAIDRDSNK